MRMKNFFLSVIVFLLALAGNSESYEIAGRWNVEGGGFVEKSFVRISLEITGHAEVASRKISDLRNINTIMSSDAQTLISLENFIDDNLSCITSYDFYLRINALNNTGLNVKVKEEHLYDEVNIPVALPSFTPTVERPYTLPAVTVNGLTYQASITSANSGTVKVTGFVDTDFAGEVEINSDCAFWRNGTSKPSSGGGSGSGCNSGSGIISLLLIILISGVRVIVRH